MSSECSRSQRHWRGDPLGLDPIRRLTIAAKANETAAGRMDDDVKGVVFLLNSPAVGHKSADRIHRHRSPSQTPQKAQRRRRDPPRRLLFENFIRLNPSNRCGLFFTRLGDAFFHQIQNGLLLIRCTPFLEERSHHRTCNVVPQGSDG